MAKNRTIDLDAFDVASRAVDKATDRDAERVASRGDLCPTLSALDATYRSSR